MSEGSKINAALCLCDLVQSTIGGNTSIKCIQDGNEEFYIRETSMFLKVLDIQHPVGQYIVSVCQSFHQQHGSGVNTLLCMIGILLRLSRNLRQQGVPLDIILKNLDKVIEDCCKKAEEIKITFLPKLHSDINSHQKRDSDHLTKYKNARSVSNMTETLKNMDENLKQISKTDTPLLPDQTNHIRSNVLCGKMTNVFNLNESTTDLDRQPRYRQNNLDGTARRTNVSGDEQSISEENMSNKSHISQQLYDDNNGCCLNVMETDSLLNNQNETTTKVPHDQKSIFNQSISNNNKQISELSCYDNNHCSLSVMETDLWQNNQDKTKEGTKVSCDKYSTSNKSLILGQLSVAAETASQGEVDCESDDEFSDCFAIRQECPTGEKEHVSVIGSQREYPDSTWSKYPARKSSSQHEYHTRETDSWNYMTSEMSSEQQLPVIDTDSKQGCPSTANKSKLTLSKTDALLKAITNSSHRVSASSILSSSRYGKQILKEQPSGNNTHDNVSEKHRPEKQKEELTKTNVRNADISIYSEVNKMCLGSSNTDSKINKTFPEMNKISSSEMNKISSYEMSKTADDEICNALSCHFLNVKEMPRMVYNQGFIKQSLGLSHGSENIMMCVLEALELTNGGGMNKIRLHSVCVDGSLSQIPVLVPGIVLQIRSDFLPVVKERRHPLTAVIINGDVSQSYRHIGYKNTLKTNVVLSGIESDVSNSWLNIVEDIICLYSIECLIVRGTVSADVIDLCLAKGVVVMEKVQFQSLQSLADQFGVTMVTYISDIYEASLFSVFVETLHEDWRPSGHVIVKSGNNEDYHKTIVLYHPSQNGRDLLEQEFQRCMETLQSALTNGFVLPGYGQTEEAIAQLLTKLSETSTDLYLSSMYEEVARGFQEYVLLVRLNVDKNGRDCTGPLGNVENDMDTTQGERTVADSIGRCDVVDDYRTKTCGWRTALNTVLTILQIDSFIILDQSTALL